MKVYELIEKLQTFPLDAFVNLVGFLILTDFSVFPRWYVLFLCKNKHGDRYNKIDKYMLSKIQSKRMSDFDYYHRRALGFLLLSIGAMLSIIS